MHEVHLDFMTLEKDCPDFMTIGNMLSGIYSGLQPKRKTLMEDNMDNAKTEELVISGPFKLGKWSKADWGNHS
ncbi:unnamed protein product [Prunus armeniaca]|uniref:Uncharacterized protein n=1 Tax=Prunus armeniaca TaxID=36596 RepID=A0A6J5Y2X7_PRUAR|nr:hypothetical protein GBA52_027035 [Prunus armeniaca]CAB4290134.1 unnamed protein product [Prunus armeniaca]CAB4320480.1 unnamed protein product [Prunus armeniaca]